MRINELKQKLKTDNFFLMVCLSLLAIAIAYLSEFIMNLNPCMLCVYQRLPYFLVVFLGLLITYFPTKHSLFRFLIVASFIAEISLALYHVGIEHYVFEESHVCQIQNQLSNVLVTTKVASSCNETSFKFMNLSMAEWNLIFASVVLYYFICRERKNGFFTWRSK